MMPFSREASWQGRATGVDKYQVSLGQISLLPKDIDESVATTRGRKLRSIPRISFIKFTAGIGAVRDGFLVTRRYSNRLSAGPYVCKYAIAVVPSRQPVRPPGSNDAPMRWASPQRGATWAVPRYPETFGARSI
jgi:hypothetical protein